MKKLIFVATIVFCVFLFHLSPLATNDPSEWYFNNMDDIRSFTYFQTNCEVRDNYIELTSQGEDPSISLSLTPNVKFEAEDKPYIAFRMKVISSASVEGGFFFGTTKYPGPQGDEFSKFSLIKDGEWHEYIIDMSTYSHNRWVTTLNNIRMDYINFALSGDKVAIDRIGMFRTIIQAKEFLTNKLSNNECFNGKKWNFKSSDTKDFWKTSNGVLSYAFGATIFTSNGIDPMMEYVFNDDEQFDAQTFPYFAYRAKTNKPGAPSVIFFGTSINPDFGDTTHILFNHNQNTEWNNYVIDMSKKSTWTGNVKKIRIDPTNYLSPSSANNGAIVYLDKAGFFKTQTDAENFLSNDISGYGKGEFLTWEFNGVDGFIDWSIWYMSHTTFDGYEKFIPLDNDPQMAISLKNNPINADKYPIVAFRQSTKTTLPEAGFFFDKDQQTSIIAQSYSEFKIDNTGKWKDYIIDLSAYPHGLWHGNITTFRIDPINKGVDLNAEIYFDKLGFFQTTEQAQAFLNENRPRVIQTSPLVLKGFSSNDYYKRLVVPSNILYKDFTSSAFDLYTQTPYGTPSYSGQAPMVFFKDSRNNYTPLAMSFITNKKFPSLAVTREGTYTLGYYYNFLEDVKGHWASDYIDFVVQRGILNGTDESFFSPDMPITRGMFVTALGRMHNVDLSPYDGKMNYKDITCEDYCSKYVQWATDLNIVKPMANNYFGIEEKLTRAEMVLIAYNYLIKFNYPVDDLYNTSSFHDIAELPDDVQSAIIKLNDINAIYGVENHKFDPDGISTRADTAVFLTRMIKAILGISMEENNTREYITRDRIRISAWVYNFPITEEWVRNYANCGFDWMIATNNIGADNYNKLHILCDKYGIELITADEGYLKENEQRTAQYYDYPSAAGHYITDEPGSDDFDNLSALANPYFAKTGKMPFINLLPMYANDAQLKYGASQAEIDYYDPSPGVYTRHCQAFADKFDAPYICTDIYPLTWNNSQKKTYPKYCESIHQIAKVARDNGREFWCCIQTFGYSTSHRQPTEEEYRWQCYTLFSFGCTAILAWLYSYPGSGGFIYPSLNDGYNRNTAAYYDAKTVFEEIHAISDVFIQYRNLGVFNHNYSSAVPYLYVSETYDTFSAITDISCPDPLLFGCFEKKVGEGWAFTVVNMSEHQAAKSTIVTFKAAGVITAYPKGIKTVLTPTNGVYTLNLETGQGIFVTIER